MKPERALSWDETAALCAQLDVELCHEILNAFELRELIPIGERGGFDFMIERLKRQKRLLALMTMNRSMRIGWGEKAVLDG